MPPKTEYSAAAERMAAENNQLKVEGLDQEDRLRRIQATVQKLEAEIAALLRKAKMMGMPLSSGESKALRDEEVERLEAAAREIEFRNEALEKQLLILKHSPASALGKKPQTSVFMRKQAWAPNLPSKPRPAVKKAVFALSEEDHKKFVAELTRQLANQQEILKKAEQETEEALIKAGANQENRWHLKTTDELRKVVKELETKTSILQSSEDHLLKTMVNEQEGHRILKEDVRGKTKDLESLKEEIEVIKKTKRVLELRKDGNAEMSAEIKKSEDELLLLEKENEALRLTAFSAGHAKIAAKRNDQGRTALLEQNEELKAEVQALSRHTSEMDAEVMALESEGPQSIARLKEVLSQTGADAKLLERNTSILRDKLDAFVGLEGADERDQGAITAAKLLAKRMGIPLYLQSAGEGQNAQEVDQLRREVRRLRVGNASEVREIQKLKQMLGLQQHLAGEWAGMGSQGTKEHMKMKRAHSNRVLGLERRIAGVVAKNERLKQQIAASQVDVRHSLPGLGGEEVRDSAGALRPSDSALRVHDMAAGKALVAVSLEHLVLARSYADFARSEPETMVLLDFFLHDTQHSPPIIGLSAAHVLHKDLEVLLDQTFLRYLHTHSAQLQLLRVRGLDFEVIAAAEVPLARLLLPEAGGAMGCRVPLLSLPVGKSAGGEVVGEVQATIQIQASAFAGLARTYLTKHKDEKPGPIGLDGAGSSGMGMAMGGAGGGARGVKEAFARHAGETYLLAVTLQSLASLVIPSLGHRSGGSSRPRLYAMFQLLDFPLEETESLNFLESSDVLNFSQSAAAFYRLPANPAWDRRLLAGKLEVGVFDETDVGGEGLIGTGTLMLAPLLSRRGLATTIPLRDARDHNSGYLTLDVSWEAHPAPRLRLSGVGRLGGKEAVQAPLHALRLWVEALGLGQVEAACSSLFENWRKEPPDGAYWDGLTEGQWKSAIRREAAKSTLLTEAEVHTVFDALADEGGEAGAGAGAGGRGGGAGDGGVPRLLRKEVFVDAIVWSKKAAEGGAAAKGGGAEVEKKLPQSGAGELVDEGEEVVASEELIRRSEDHTPDKTGDRALPVEGEGREALMSLRESVELGVGKGGPVEKVESGDARVRVVVSAVRCLPSLLEKKEVEDLAVRVACLIEGLEVGEQRFDNRQVPAGFLELQKEWGRSPDQRARLRAKASDPASAVEVQLWSVPPKREDGAPVQPLADQVLGVWRVSMAQLLSGGSLIKHTITIKAVDDDTQELLEATVDVEARVLG